MLELKNSNIQSLIYESIKNGETNLSKDGAVLAYTGKYTGRAANDKFIVLDEATCLTVDWSTNKQFSIEAFNNLQIKVEKYFEDFKSICNQSLYIQKLYAGITNKVKFEITTTSAWHALFAKTMFSDLSDEQHADWKILHAPHFYASPELDSTNSRAFIIINYTKQVVLIGGTSYAGEIKKSIFTVLNFLLPQQGILPMHSSVNVGKNGDSAIFFGLSGTGKTTLSADPERILVGDDEHGWSDNNIFNFEDGCYAKAINLSQKNEPEIWRAVNSFGTVLENVAVLPDGNLNFHDSSITENTRAAYKLNKIPNASTTRTAPHPSVIIMLTCDAYGILPPVASLTPDQAVYYFLSGYTAKIAGTEAGVKEPTATFSTCFGAPFLPRHPTEYANLLLEKIIKHNVDVWLVNTGWVGGAYGTGSRISLPTTRRIIDTILSISSSHDKYSLFSKFVKQRHPNYIDYLVHTDPNFGFETLEGPWTINEWQDEKLYKQKAQELVQKFKDNFKKYEGHVSANILNAGPR